MQRHLCEGYEFGVAWIALNDEALETNVKEISELVSTMLLADLFNKTPEKVAKDILAFRKRQATIGA